MASVLAVALLGACAGRPYQPAPVDPAAVQAAWLAADPVDPALREPLARAGIDTAVWPLPAWDADALAALALQRHPDLAVARAELRAAEGAAAVLRQRSSLGAGLALEHHSEDGRSSSPWSLGVAIDMLLSGAPRRAALAAQADALAREGVEQAALAVWSVRQGVHAAHRELAGAVRRRLASQALLQTRRELLVAEEARLAQGAVGGRAPALARQAEAEAAHADAEARAAERRARARLAEAVALPVGRLADLPLALEAAFADPPALAAPELQREALLNRLDLRAALARHERAEGALRVELARQWPEIVLKPGVAWDQGDRVWSLGVGLALPPGGRNRAGIDAALAQRALEAHRIAALQTAALARLDAAREALAATEGVRAAADAALEQAERLLQRTERRFAAGDADRIDRLSARAAVQEAERRRVDALAARAGAVAALEEALQQPLAAARSDARLFAAPAGPTP